MAKKNLGRVGRGWQGGRGFTLIELMLVVTLVGVLAMIAVFGVRKYMASAKTAEARNALGQMGQGAVAAFESERIPNAILPMGGKATVTRQMCQSGTASTGVPSSIGSIAARKYQSSKADWTNPADVTANQGFPCLKFEMGGPQYFQYQYVATGTTTGTFVSTAHGDLDGNGILSTFTLNGAVQADGRLTLAPGIGEVSPEE